MFQSKLFLAADGMSANGVEALGQSGHGCEDFPFRGTQIHDDAGVRCERWQLLNEINDRSDRSREDDEIGTLPHPWPLITPEGGSRGARGKFNSGVNDSFGKSKLEGGRIRVESDEA